MTITMYGADWCGDCRRAKAYFADNNIDYAYIDLESHPEAVDVVLERNDGLKRIPFIVFSDDNSHLTEPSNEALTAKLAELAGAKPDNGEEFAVSEVLDVGRFELRRDGDLVGFATYTMRGESVVVPHVETFPEHRGQGYAARLMAGLLDIVRRTGRTITPLCPFAAQYLRDHPDQHDLLAS